MRRERGSVALYMLFSLVLATAVGYVTWRSIRDARLSAAREAAASPRPMAHAASRPVIPTEPADHRMEPMAPVAAAPVAAEQAVDPSDTLDPADMDSMMPADVPASDRDIVAFGTPGIAGDLDRASIERTFKRYTNRFERCVRKAREKNEAHRTDMRVRFQVTAEGAVEQLEARSDTLERVLSTCVMELVQKLHFDKPGDGNTARVVYPILFVPAVASPP